MKFTSGRNMISCALLIAISVAVSCSKKQDNTEVLFTVHFVPKNQNELSPDSCSDKGSYHEVFSPGKGLVPIRSLDSIQSYCNLPLNISTDTSVFVFKSKNRSDILVLKYKRNLAPEDNDFTMKINNVRMIRSTFDSLKVKCKNSSSNCNDAESITIYY